MTPSPTAAPAATRPVKPPLRRTPLTLLLFLLAGFASLVAVLAAAIVIYIGQDAYKAGHQTSPTSAVRAYLDATLNDHNADLAGSYTCANQRIHQQTTELIRRIEAALHDHPDAEIKYRWSRVRRTDDSEARTTVKADVYASTIIKDAVSTSPEQTWRFSMRNESGWKVCGLTIPAN